MSIQMNILPNVKMSCSLNFAVAFGDEHIVKLLLGSGFNVNGKPFKLGRTLLHIAVRNNNYRIAEMLLEQGANVNEFSDDSLTPLHIAVSNRSEVMVKLLLQYKANVNPLTKFKGKTPLYMAVEYNCPEIAEILLKNGASIKDSTILNTTILHVALRIQSYNISKLILDYVKGDILNMKDRLEGKAPIHLAMDWRQLDIIELLLKQGANVEEAYIDREGTIINPLTMAVKRRDDKMVDLLLQNGAHGNANECLHYAVRYRYKNIVHLLLEYGIAKVDNADNEGITALNLAVTKGYKEIAEICLKHGANVTTPGINKIPVLYYAIKNADLEMAALLINSGAPINEFVTKNITLLDVAIKSRSIAITKLLLERGAVINSSSANEEQAFALKYSALLFSEDHLASKENYRFVHEHPSWARFHEKCEQEIEQLRNEKIVGNISFYNLLTKGQDALAAYARNEEFVAAFPKSKYKSRFSLYADSLALNFMKGRVRNILLQKASGDFEKMSCYRIPNVCAQRILKLVSNEDLRNFIRGVCNCKSRLPHTCFPQLLVVF